MRRSGATPGSAAEEACIDHRMWSSGTSTCKEDAADSPGFCPLSCRQDIDDLVASCAECALIDVTCDEKIDLGAYPGLSSQDLSFEYRAPVVMAGADGSTRDNVVDGCATYLQDNVDGVGLEGDIESSRSCLDKTPDFDCSVQDDTNDNGAATIVCSGCSPDGSLAVLKSARELSRPREKSNIARSTLACVSQG